MSTGVNSSAPTTGEIIAGVYNATPPTLVDGQAAALQLDINGQLKTAGGGGGGGNVNITGINGSAPALANPLPVELSDGTNPVGTAGNPLSVNVISGGGSNTSVGVTGVLAPTSATEIGAIDGTGKLQGVSATNPLPITGSISATNPSVGTTGVAAPTSATEIGVIDGTGKLQGASASNPVRVDPTGTTTQPISAASLPLPSGAATDASVTGLQVAQASTTAGEKGPLVQGAVTTAAPTYTTGQTDPLSLTTAGALRVDGSGVTQPVSGTVTANAGTNLNTSALALDATLTGGSQKTKIVDTGGVNVASVSAAGAVKVDGSAVTQPISGTVATNADTTIGGTVAPSKEFLVAGKTNDGTPQYQPIPEGAGGRSVIVEGIAGGTVVPISGTVTANQGTNNATPWNENIAQVGGSAVSLGAKVSASSIPVVLASDQANIPSVVSAANSSTVALGSNAVFTGTSESVLGFEQITVIAFANQASAAAGLSIQQSQDGTNWDTTHTATVAASTNTPITVPVLSQFFRVVYTNGASAQATFRLQAIKQVFNNGVVRGFALQGATIQNGLIAPVIIGGLDIGNGNLIRSAEVISGGARSALIVTPCAQPFTDNSTTIAASAAGGGGNSVQAVATCASTGATAQSMLRTPNIFKTATATASGNTAAWTPTAGKKFRIMRFMIQVTGNAITAGGAVITVSFQDAAAAIGLAMDVFVPATAFSTGDDFISPWVDLGNGFLSAAANNVLNINLSAALTAGNVRVTVCGTEE